MEAEYKLSIAVLASNEVVSLRETIQTIINTCKVDDIKEIIIFLKSQTCPSALESKKLEYIFSPIIKISVQKGGNLLDSLIEIPRLVQGTHFIIISSDLEMDPASVADLIQISKNNPYAICCAAKWKKDSIIRGYGFAHQKCSKYMNSLAAFLIHSNARDLFSIFQIYPVCVYNCMNFQNPSQFPYEYTLKPVSLGVHYIEIPTCYKSRTEANTSASLPYLIKMGLRFLLTALRYSTASTKKDVHDKIDRVGIIGD